MTYSLTRPTDYTKNYCNRTLIVEVIAENAVMCFCSETHYRRKPLMLGIYLIRAFLKIFI